jgi:drug/metabolite transporter (DMT)-like permease
MSPRLTHPYLLLTLCVLFWSGNFVVGRAMVDTVPPIALAFWRWTLAALILLPWAWRPLRRNWPLLRANLRRMTLLALLGVSGFNTLVYLGLQHTTAINGLLLQSSMPLLIIAFNGVLFRQPAGWLEGGSILLSLCGVLLILSHGAPANLLDSGWNPGDLWVFGAVMVWALYSTLLRWRPAGLEPLAFLGFTLIVGATMILPLYLWELSRGAHLQLGWPSMAAIGYVALFPSVLSYLFWNRGVAEVGANAAGHFIHLSPVFGSLLAVLLLGETFAWYHAAGAAMVALAIGLTVFAGRR